MYQGTHGHYDFVEGTWHRAWNRPTRDEVRCCEAFAMVRDQVVYRKLADNKEPITVDQMVKLSGINVARWMDRYDEALQILANNLWIVYVMRVPPRTAGKRTLKKGSFVLEKFLRNDDLQVHTAWAQLELSGRALSMTTLPSVHRVISTLGEGVLA